MNATIIQIEYPRDDIAILTIKPDEPVRYMAGQYLNLAVSDMGVRPYSIANRPLSENLEIHVKNTGGETSRYILEELQENDRVRIEGVEGDAYYCPDDPAPLVFIAGGLGITPVKAMIEEALHHDHVAPIRLFWGLRDESDDYLSAYFRMLADVVERFEVHIQTGGIIADAVLQAFALLEGYKIYLAGSEGMVQATEPLLIGRGAAQDQILYDRYVIPSTKKEGDKEL